MQRRTVWLTSMGAGAAAAYLLDPTSGNRRRAVTRDAVVRTAHVLADGASKAGRDLRNRSRGIAAATMRLLRRDQPDAAVLVERVRAALGRVVSHPHAIEVEFRDGTVVLKGPILAAEESALVSAVSCVRGVRRVETRLDVHEQADNIPALQGGPSRPPMPTVVDVRQRNWAPSTRLIVGGSAIGMVASGARRRDVPGLVLLGAGAALLARAATNLEFKRLLGLGAGRRAVDVAARDERRPVRLEPRHSPAR